MVWRFLFCAAVCAMLTSAVSADTLIFNNSNYTGYVYPEGGFSYTEMLDYGTSPGGRISKFVFGYVSYSTQTVWVTFYRYTDITDIGWQIKRFAVSGVPSTGGYMRTFEYVIPEDQRFELTNGKFGYSLESSGAIMLALATGGTGIDRYYWQYDDWFETLYLYDMGVAYNIYFKLYTAPPINEVTCDITGWKFNDADADGVWDTNESAMTGWEFFLDSNNDGVYQASEPNTVTDPNGFYRFENMPSPATYRVREVMQTGWTQTLPASGGNYQYIVSTEPNNAYGPFNFGNTTQTIIKYGGGAGTLTDPYRIKTAAHMNEIGLDTADWNKYFRLENDIDMSGYTGTQYNRIGNETIMFTGSFDGNNHIIRNFSYATAATTNHVGLFGYTYNATLRNLGLVDVNINVSSQGAGFIAGLAGYCRLGTVSNCFVTGQVSSANGSGYVGGLAGMVTASVSNCRSITNVTSGSSSQSVGGFAGLAGNMTNCYSAGAVSAGAGSIYVGGLVGSTNGTLTSCYWDRQTAGILTGPGLLRTTAQMRMQSNYTGWNFTTIWRICDWMNYPRLRWEPLPVGDFVCPEGVELADVVFMADQWLMTGPSDADIAPTSPDGKINLQDFALLTLHWMEGTD